MLGIGRSLAYSEVRRYLATDGREGIPAVRIGSAIRIPGPAWSTCCSPRQPRPCPPATLHASYGGPVATGPRASRTRRSSSLRSPFGRLAQLPFAEPTGADRAMPFRLRRAFWAVRWTDGCTGAGGSGR